MHKSLQSKSRRLEGLPVSSSKAGQHQPGVRIKATTEALLLLGKYVMEGRDRIPACAVIVYECVIHIIINGIYIVCLNIIQPFVGTQSRRLHFYIHHIFVPAAQRPQLFQRALYIDLIRPVGDVHTLPFI